MAEERVPRPWTSSEHSSRRGPFTRYKLKATLIAANWGKHKETKGEGLITIYLSEQMKCTPNTVPSLCETGSSPSVNMDCKAPPLWNILTLTWTATNQKDEDTFTLNCQQYFMPRLWDQTTTIWIGSANQAQVFHLGLFVYSQSHDGAEVSHDMWPGSIFDSQTLEPPFMLQLCVWSGGHGAVEMSP